MFKPIVFFAGLMLATAAGAQDNQDLAALLGAREGIEDIDISPSGQHVLYLTPGPGESTMLVVQDLAGQQEPRVVVRSNGNPERLTWCAFVTDDRIVCQIYVLVESGETFTPFTRLLSIGTDGGPPQQLGQRESFFDASLRQFDGVIIDWLPAERGAVLMSRSYVPEVGRIGTRLVRQSEGLAVDRIDVRTLRSRSVEAANPQAVRYISDGRGHVRVMAVATTRATGIPGSRIDYFYRAEGSERWQPLGSYDTLSDEGIRPQAVDPNLNAVYVLRKLNGRFALYRIKLDGSMAEELVYANDQVDVDGVVRSERGSRVIGVTFADEQRRIIYFDQNYAGMSRALGRAVPNLPLINFVESSLDGNRVLVHAGSDADPGRYYVYDRSTRNLNEILLVRPQLEPVRLASVRAVSYPAADGVGIPAYLTLPPGGEGRNLPAIVMPHGGPEARDEWGFDWLAQYFAQLGYAVLQPNYRGSAGYGEQWLEQNGFRGWRTSIGDITAGARWLAAQGIADPQRLAIVGWSYGGYAALQSAVVEPDLFRAVVAIAPVTDLQQIKDDARYFTSARLVAEYIGSGPHVSEGSPLPNAARITRPVLMFHGDRDLNVLVGHAQRMDRALRDAGRQSELVIFPGLEHDLGDGDARRRMLDRIRTFLAGHVGG